MDRLRNIREAEAKALEEEKRKKEIEKETATKKMAEPSHPSGDVDISFLQSFDSEEEDNIPLAKQRMDKGKQVLSDNETSESRNSGSEENKHPTESET